MKTKLLFTLLLAFVIQFTTAQMTVTQNGNIVTFSFNDTTTGDVWDANGNPINFYSWVEVADTSNSVENELAGSWPGTAMTASAGNIYEISVDLSTFYPVGTLISEISYILNYDTNQTATLLATNAGYTSYTLSAFKVNQQNSKVKFVNGQLFGNDSVAYSIYIYNVLAQEVKSYSNQNLSQSNGLDLNLPKNELFIIKLESIQGPKILKVISK